MSTRNDESDVAVVLTHFQSPEDLRLSLESVRTHGGPRVTEVWVADSQADTAMRNDVLAGHEAARYLPFKRNVGYGALVNIGVAASKSRYVLVLNADVQLTPGAVDALVSELDRDPSVGVVFPQLRYEDGTLQHSVFAFHKPMTVVYRRTPFGNSRAGRRELARFLDEPALRQAVATGRSMDVDWALGAAMLVRREAFENVGPLDEDYFLYFEDVDWCLRVWRNGWACRYLPTATCVHHYGRKSAEGGFAAIFTNWLTRRHIRSAVRFFRLHGLKVQGAQAMAPRVIDLREPLPVGGTQEGAA